MQLFLKYPPFLAERKHARARCRSCTKAGILQPFDLIKRADLTIYPCIVSRFSRPTYRYQYHHRFPLPEDFGIVHLS